MVRLKNNVDMDRYRRLKDISTYIDESFYDFIEDIEVQRTIIREVIQDILIQDKNALVTIGLLVGVLNRQLECSGASMFLASRKFFRDSATLILTLMELRLDLEYISKNVDNELKWISQIKANKKLWGVRDQINAVSKDESEKSSDINVYRFLSIIKHGNPAHGHLAFQISVKPDRILIDETNSSVNPKQLLGLLSYQFERSFDSALVIAKRHEIDLSKYEPRMNEIKAIIKTKSFNNLKEMAREFFDATNKAADQPNHTKPIT